MTKNKKPLKQTHKISLTFTHVFDNDSQKKIVSSLKKYTKAIIDYGEFAQVVGILFQEKNNIVVSTSKLSNKTVYLLKDFQISRTTFSRCCKKSLSLKISHLGTSYYFSAQNTFPKEFETIFNIISPIKSDSTLYSYIINPLIINNMLIGIILVSSSSLSTPTPASILPIASFSKDFLIFYKEILNFSETLLSHQQPKDGILKERVEIDKYLKTLENARQEFVAMLVHDIRSPLTTVLGTLDLLIIQSRKKNEIKLTPNLTSLLNVAYDTCKQIIQMVTELLDLSRMEHAPLQLNIAPIFPQEIITKVVEECYTTANEKYIRLNFGCSPDLKPILVDPQYLQRALVNLLSNAIKYTPEGGEIWFEARAITNNDESQKNHVLAFTVIDSGSGISEDEQSYIFDPYFQASNRKGQLGIGLGLAIVKKIALAHGGDVSVKSQVGVGSAFSLSIPVENIV